MRGIQKKGLLASAESAFCKKIDLWVTFDEFQRDVLDSLHSRTALATTTQTSSVRKRTTRSRVTPAIPRLGSYGYRDEYGIFRRVNYVADANGFRATIDTNEPGTAAGRSADAVFNANPVAAPVRAKSASAPFPIYVPAPAYGSGYTARGGVAPWAE
ncbi:hypothetical protein HPB48_026668 [Haemaphysalis longicornis]|uniref:Cuticle protein n=1 Tax=Haemaphysalis longicornis TaxID=44386 RepID=A0A9J6HCE8_HAELO|nr:hypothetical protein HPB48_026668 [Haemaphysalis longicornis]